MTNSLINDLIDLFDDNIDIRILCSILSKKLFDIYKFESFEINVLEGSFLERIYGAININTELFDDIHIIETLFDKKTTPFDGSLTGSVIKSGNPLLWIHKENENFQQYIEQLKNDNTVYYRSAITYLQNMPSGNINNILIVPFTFPKTETGDSQTTNYKVSLCIHIHNLFNGTLEIDLLEEAKVSISTLLNRIKIHFYNAIFYNRTNIELSIDKSIKDISRKSNKLPDLLINMVTKFNDYVRSPLSTIWLFDPAHKLLGLSSIIINKEFLDFDNNPLIYEEIIAQINDTKKYPRVLKDENSVLGVLISKNTNIVQIEDITTSQQFAWKPIAELLETNHFIGIKLFNNDTLIALIGLHPKVSTSDFYRIKISYFISFINQLMMNFNFLRENDFRINTNSFVNFIKNEVAFQESFYNELVYKIKELINAEACSFFHVIHHSGADRGVYLIATTDKNNNQIDSIRATKIYNIDNQSITGYVAKTGKSLIIYDVENVNLYYPEIANYSEAYMEETVSLKHHSLIIVPISFKDANNEKHTYIIRCVNKKATLIDGIEIGDLFSENDLNLLENFSEIFQRFFRHSELIKERNYILDTLTHEVRNPISTIRKKLNSITDRTFTGLKTTSPEEILQKLKDIDLMVKLLNHIIDNKDLINNLLQKKVIPTNKVQIDIYKTVENLIYWLSPDLFNYDLPISTFNIEKLERNFIIIFDEMHFYQVLYNLLNNALKYSTIVQKRPKIDISLEIGHQFSYIIVSDNGIGVPELQQGRLFELGYRSQYAIENKIQGKGFGLWLSKNICLSNSCELVLMKPSNPTKFAIKIPATQLRYNTYLTN